jgi:hypothetical protein
MIRMKKMSSYDLSTPWNIAYHQSRLKDAKKADDFSGPFSYMKHHFHDFVQIAFLNDRNVEIAFECPFDIMKNCFIDITKDEI